MNDYVVESGASARARARRRRAVVTLTLLVLALFGAFWFAYSYWKQPAAPAAAPTPTCTTPAPRTAAVRVNVYNATTREGLAASTADLLKKRGFLIGKIANDPLNRTVKGTAEVRYGKAGARVAVPVIALVTKPAKVVDRRKDASVDLVLGNGFKALAPLPVATSALPACKPSTTPTTARKTAAATKTK